MKTDDIPQDDNPTLGGVRKQVYAVDADGRYTARPTTGWEVESIVTSQAVAEYARLAADALSRARAGESSPLEFHMYDRRLELPTLAAAAGLWQWQVRRHLRPGPFRSLSPALLERYAATLGISVDTLRGLPSEPA
jgi:hypothetical protein